MMEQFFDILITEKNLYEYGFNKDEIHDCWIILQTEFDIDIEFFDGQIHLVGQKCAEPLEHIKSYSDLRKLYWALTGQELEYLK